jgi:hypothetical protein
VAPRASTPQFKDDQTLVEWIERLVGNDESAEVSEFNMQIDIAALEAELSSFQPEDVLTSLNTLDREAVRGPETSTKAATGKVKSTAAAGVSIRLDEGLYHFRVMLADGVWQEVSMTDESFPGFLDAMRKRLH